MEGNLVIVESPAKAKTIRDFLGEDYIVKSSYGHIRDLQESSLSIDIEHGFKPEYVVPAAKKKVVSELKAAASKAQTVWLASDEDREGEAISWHLAETLGLDPARTRRIVFHEITKNAILDAVKNPRNIDINLVNAQQARRVLDRLVGFELSPILWRKVQRGLSAGRVQSVALRLIVDREREIMAFVPESYYKVDGVFAAGGATVKGLLDTRFGGIAQARQFLQDSIGAKYTVGAVEKKESVRYPAPPFTTSTLQQEAAARLHFPVSVTMRVAQSLYEKGLITYMRTDSTNLSSLATGTAKRFIEENFGAQYHHFRQYRTKSKGAQEAHEAIRPTYIDRTSIEGTQQEKKLYELIWKRTVASQMAEAKVLNTTVKVDSDKRPEKYGIQAASVLFDGFLKVYRDEDDEKAAGIPDINVGDVLEAKSVTAECKYTQPASRYSEGTLVKKLEELGIGRPSTYSPTITTLTTARGYVVKGDKEGVKMDVVNLTLKGDRIGESAGTETVGAEKGKLIPQEIGIIVTDYLMSNFADIMDYDFTANVEKDFDAIAEGKKVWNQVIAAFYPPFHNKVDDALNDRQFSHVEREIGVDPETGLKVIAKFGQYGPYVQKGDDANRQYASLSKGQLIENLTLEEALRLFQLPRTVGEYEGVSIVATKGRFGPYLRYGDKNVSLPRGVDPMKVTVDQCVKLIEEAKHKDDAVAEIKRFETMDITIINGRYGPYIKHGGKNYKIPAGKDAAALTLSECQAIIDSGASTSGHRKFAGRRRR